MLAASGSFLCPGHLPRVWQQLVYLMRTVLLVFVVAFITTNLTACSDTERFQETLLTHTSQSS